MIIFTQLIPEKEHQQVTVNLALTAEERTKTRQYIETLEGKTYYLRLPRGIVLKAGDLLTSDAQDIWAKVIAKPEPIITVRANHSLDLLKAAYHLGNRHVRLEITSDYLRFSPDPVLSSMLVNQGLTIQEEIAPFYPEGGAYGHHH
ncbi:MULTISPECIES: urease accessory protein UreE [Planktothrix]|jgi:urease accessory protein|uniref:Urease accessory protein UreE n=2 Tax=Planktothrix TaxID=54304 RepID=A0A479ZR65_PLAAG|nr:MULTISPECIES: urease accessory protein UreE [Planktothrix]CAD5933659.1 Urease accessory protein UreE [Planktothrix rubescens]CAC5341180.1 Urease accessory protein UreE [Planktothrix rubescens NIVA-CYA 18]CAD0229324.1 Urease accessory protein UreE [Planktothrix agardhii]CAD5933266.1 Urease accessory protein UreE [Planktothrix rubescens NIVA-CYA 18]CAH2571970.1 Urease accessory protein UreE [Planktothrix rubescens]